MVKFSRLVFGVVGVVCLGANGFSQAADEPWVLAYSQGLAAAKAGNWTAARAAFQSAAQSRAGDLSGATVFDEGPTRKIQWRKGAPYSPNFGAAYAEYRLAMASSDPAAAKAMYETAAAELNALRQKGGASVAVYYVLQAAYAAAGQSPKQEEVQKELGLKRDQGLLTFRVDTEVMTSEDLVAARTLDGSQGAVTTVGNQPATPGDRIPFNANKYAVLIGVTKYNGYFADVPNAVIDCNMLAESLTKNAGYAPDHILVLAEPTYEQMLTGITNFVSKLPPEATVFFFYAGAGVVNPTDKADYLVPSGVTSATAYETYVKKTDLLAVLAPKANYTIAFFEVDRLADANKNFWGSSRPEYGSFALANACLEGQRSLAQVTSKGWTGLFAAAGTRALNLMRGAKINAKEFIFKVNEEILDQNSSSDRGQSQTPTLPMNTLLGDETTF